MRYKIITEYTEFVQLRGMWNNLVKHSSSKAKVYLDHDWMHLWYKYYQNPVSLFIILVFDDETLIAIAPFCLARRKRLGLSGKAVSFMGISLADYNDIICDASRTDRAAICQYIFDVLQSEKRKWSLVSLYEVPQESDILKNSHFKNIGIRLSTCSTCGYVDTSEPWEIYEQTIMPKGMRQKHRRLEQLGDIRFARITEVNDVEPFMDELFNVHIARWHGTGSESRFAEENQRQYFKEVATTLFQRGLMDLSYLRLGDQRVAYHFGYQDDDRLHIYLHTFNPQYSKYSLGRIFLYHLIKNSYSSFHYIDFLRGSESYKRHFRLSESYNYAIGYYKSSLHQWVHTKLSSNHIGMTVPSKLAIDQDNAG